jgi:hypothetical protein
MSALAPLGDGLSPPAMRSNRQHDTTSHDSRGHSGPHFTLSLWRATMRWYNRLNLFLLIRA